MKRKSFTALLVAVFILGIISISSATTLFYEDFESDLSNWTGESSGTHDGVIVVDLLDSLNNVLSFTGLNSGGDIFTTSTSFSSIGNQYILSFDYLGTNNDSGGFIGFSYDLPGSHVWLAGSDTNYTGTTLWNTSTPGYLIGDNSWHHYSISFTTTAPIHLMLEEFAGSDSIIGNAYFDNILLADANGPDPIPEPGTILLLGTGLMGLVGLGYRRKKNKV